MPKNKVICSKFSDKECPRKCVHAIPHIPIFDIYDFDHKGNPVSDDCNKLYGQCGYRDVIDTNIKKVICT